LIGWCLMISKTNSDADDKKTDLELFIKDNCAQP